MLSLPRVALVALFLFLAACTKPAVWAPEADVLAARYVHPGPASISLFTIVSNSSGNGDHAALMINASQRVLFDPAGSWRHPLSPERHDVHFGFTEAQLGRYTRYHARGSHRVRIQHLELPPETAETILALAQRAGPVPNGHCARAIGAIFRQVPGLQHMPVAFPPNTLSNAFATIRGVREENVTSDAEPTRAQTYPGQSRIGPPELTAG